MVVRDIWKKYGWSRHGEHKTLLSNKMRNLYSIELPRPDHDKNFLVSNKDFQCNERHYAACKTLTRQKRSSTTVIRSTRSTRCWVRTDLPDFSILTTNEQRNSRRKESLAATRIIFLEKEIRINQTKLLISKDKITQQYPRSIPNTQTKQRAKVICMLQTVEIDGQHLTHFFGTGCSGLVWRDAFARLGTRCNQICNKSIQLRGVESVTTQTNKQRHLQLQKTIKWCPKATFKESRLKLHPPVSFFCFYSLPSCFLCIYMAANSGFSLNDIIAKGGNNMKKNSWDFL